ncbi:hypothetical protein [Halovivax gelatinilyticus]|uniref:hypothetical protein n=1 Tax=Halovivax gelatinilyticus TaxID=2961597 RepID=UPI0020CA98A4|nr:hypothetical protein [Halovivax gelatinilyticus]
MTDNPFCYRCNDSLDGRHWIRLTTEHRGAVADNYRDVERLVCPDCLAGIGLLEIDPEWDDQKPDPESVVAPDRLFDRL